MNRIFQSIPLKISLSILVIESVILALFGGYYSNRLVDEIDRQVAEELALPAMLLSERALSFTSVEDFSILTDIIRVDVLDAFVVHRDGVISVAADPARKGKDYRVYLDRKERQLFAGGGGKGAGDQIEFIDSRGKRVISFLAPITDAGKHVGDIYIKVDGGKIAAQKRKIKMFFAFGVVVVVVITTLLKTMIIQRMVIPRVVRTSSVLQRIAGGDFAVRIDDTGAEDQLGIMMDHVNAMISTIEQYTVKLKVLNSGAERFGLATTVDEIVEVATEIIEAQLPVRRDYGEPVEGEEQKAAFTLPITDNERHYQVVAFIADDGVQVFDPLADDFVTTLTRMVSVAVDRVKAFDEISAAESRYRHLFTSAPGGILRTSPAGRILEANPVAATMSGYDSVEEMIEKVNDVSTDMYVDPLDREQVKALLETEGRVHDFEVDLKRKDGSIFPASVSAYAVRGEDGRVSEFDVRISDISERKRREKAEKDHLAAQAVSLAKSKLVADLEWKNKQLVEALNELKATQMQLMQSEKMAAVGMTAGGVAHDLNNILSGVVSFPEFLLSSLPESSEMREPIETMLGSGKRAAAIVADLLTLTQGAVYGKKLVQLDVLVKEILASVEFEQFQSDYPDIKLLTEFADDPVLLHCSSGHIAKMMLNVVMHAAEVMNGSGVVTLSVCGEAVHRATHAAGEESVDRLAVLRVMDNGPKIEEENLRHIFEPFYTRKVMGISGTGLGLTVVWNVVNEHNGNVDVESGPDGTSFTLQFPAYDGETAEVNEELQASGDQQGGGRILVVDDEPLQRDIARKVLERFGYEVEVCSSGEEAVEFLQTTAVDLLLLDMLMPPGINGLETYKRILKIHPRQKAIVVSGYSESKDVKRAMQLGAGAYVKKPYTMHQITQSVKKELAAERFSSD
jgi:PAS domain S-box-containing protein